MALGLDLEAIEKPKAKEREKAGKGAGGSGGRGRKKPSGKLPEGFTDTRDAVGAGVGMSGKTYERAKAVTKAAKANPKKYGKFAAAMDKTRKVAGAYKAMQRADAADLEAGLSGGVPWRSTLKPAHVAGSLAAWTAQYGLPVWLAGNHRLAAVFVEKFLYQCARAVVVECEAATEFLGAVNSARATTPATAGIPAA